MELIRLKLPARLKGKLAAEAKRRRVSQSVIVRESLQAALSYGPPQGKKGSCADLAGELLGILSGPRDLSTEQHYLELELRNEVRQQFRSRAR